MNHQDKDTAADTNRKHSARGIVCTVALAAAVSTLYLLTLRDGVGGEADSTKWQFLGKVWGVPHTTGYPLYVSLNHVFSHLPVGTQAWRVNLMSALFAVLAIAVLHRILAGITGSEVLACAAALLLAVSPMFWTFAVVAGVYSLNAFLICLVIYFLFRWADEKRRTGSMKYFYAAAAVFALSFGNHSTMITMLPAFVVFGLMVNRRAVLRLRTILIVLLFFAISAMQYSIPFIQTTAASAYIENRVESFSDLLGLITASRYREYWFMGGLSGFLVQVPLYFVIASRQFTAFGIVFAFAGACLGAARRRAKFVFILLYLLTSLFVTLNYYVEQMRYQLIPSYLLLSLLIGSAAGLLGLKSARRGGRTVMIACCTLMLSAMAGYTMFSNLPDFRDKQVEARLNDRLAGDIVDSMPEGGVILAYDYKSSMLLFYKTLGEERGREKGLRVLHDTSWKKHAADGAAANGGSFSEFDVEAVGKLLKGEEIDWAPLATDDDFSGRHSIFFMHGSKLLLDMKGFASKPVDLPGECGEKNEYGGRKIRLFRITARPLSAEETEKIFASGVDFFNKGFRSDAWRMFSELVDRNPNFAQARFFRGLILLEKRDYAAARGEFERVLDLIPDYAPAIEALKKQPPRR